MCRRAFHLLFSHLLNVDSHASAVHPEAYPVVRRILDGQAEDNDETRALFDAAFTGPDFEEGVSAFLEKRKAVFK